jgi:hypothetical protein
MEGTKIKNIIVNKCQVALQGEVVETGVAFVITMNLTSSRAILKSREAKKTSKKQKKLNQIR